MALAGRSRRVGDAAPERRQRARRGRVRAARRLLRRGRARRDPRARDGGRRDPAPRSRSGGSSPISSCRRPTAGCRWPSSAGRRRPPRRSRSPRTRLRSARTRWSSSGRRISARRAGPARALPRRRAWRVRRSRSTSTSSSRRAGMQSPRPFSSGCVTKRRISSGLKVSDTPFERFSRYLLPGLDIFVGPEALIHEGLAAGAVGAVSALASAFPRDVAPSFANRAPGGAARLAELRRVRRALSAAGGAQAAARTSGRSGARGRARRHSAGSPPKSATSWIHGTSRCEPGAGVRPKARFRTKACAVGTHRAARCGAPRGPEIYEIGAPSVLASHSPGAPADEASF